jgi:HAD superfamily hydrolase (TIGR01509 family)
MPPAPKALIFDYDGLLVDSERVEADFLIEILAEWGATVTYTDFGHLFGSVDADHHWDELVNGLCGRTITELEVALLARHQDGEIKEHLPLMPGVIELLDEAKGRGLGVGLATGNTYAAVERRLGRHGVFDRFDAVVTRRDVARGKPAPDIFLEVARGLDASPAECLVLEDSVPGCEGALAAGMRVIACPSVVSAHCEFPVGAARVATLLQVTL